MAQGVPAASWCTSACLRPPAMPLPCLHPPICLSAPVTPAQGSIYMVFDYMDHDLAGLLERQAAEGRRGFTVAQARAPRGGRGGAGHGRGARAAVTDELRPRSSSAAGAAPCLSPPPHTHSHHTHIPGQVLCAPAALRPGAAGHEEGAAPRPEERQPAGAWGRGARLRLTWGPGHGGVRAHARAHNRRFLTRRACACARRRRHRGPR